MDRLEKFRELFDEHFDRTTLGYERFAKILSDVAERGTGRAWQKTFIYNLLNGVRGFKVGDQMWAALLIFEKERSLALRRQTIFSLQEIPMSAVVIGKPKRCAWSGCDEWLIPDHPNRRYCPHNRCRLEARNERRRNKN